MDTAPTRNIRSKIALRAGASATTWFFADGVHPTTGRHKAISDAFELKLKEFGWL